MKLKSFKYLIGLLVFFSGLGNLIFSIKKIDIIKIIIISSNFNIVLSNDFPKLGCLLYFSCILFELI